MKKIKEVKKEENITMPKQTIREYVKHNFTDEEMLSMQKELPSKTISLRHLESDKALVMKQFGSDIERIKTEIESLSDRLNSGFEHRMLSCEVVFNWKAGTKDVIHPETKEIVKTLDITNEDRQAKFDFENEIKEQRERNIYEMCKP